MKKIIIFTLIMLLCVSLVSATTLTFDGRRITLPTNKVVIPTPTKTDNTPQVVPISFLNDYAAGLVAQQTIITNINQKVDNNYADFYNKYTVLESSRTKAIEEINTLKTTSLKDFTPEIATLQNDVGLLKTTVPKDYSADITNLQKDVNTLKNSSFNDYSSNISIITSNIISLQSTTSVMQSTITNLQMSNVNFQNTINSLTQTVTTLQEDNTKLNNEIKIMKEELCKVNKEFKFCEGIPTGEII